MRNPQAIRLLYIFGLLFVALASLVPNTSAQAPVPKASAQYEVTLRFRLIALGLDRVAQFERMLRALESLGFAPDPQEQINPEAPGESRLHGSVDRQNAAALLAEPHVRSELLIPSGQTLPDDPAALVKVQITLVSGLAPDRQHLLAAQTLSRLAYLHFEEALGYDNRGHSRLVGWVPRADLYSLLDDLRYQPSGWLAPAAPVSDLPMPIRAFSPILVTEVLPAAQQRPPAAVISTVPAPPTDQPNLSKISPELRALATGPHSTQTYHLEIILSKTPDLLDQTWRRILSRAVPGLEIEGLVGPIVTVETTADGALALSTLSEVSGVRFPLAASALLLPPMSGPNDNATILRESGLEGMHAAGQQGRGVRVAVVDSDFRGFERFIGSALPPNTPYIDLTAERNSNLQPDGFTGAPNAVGHGTQCALVVALAAPQARILLVRVDPATPYQLAEVDRLIQGGSALSESMLQRGSELVNETDRLRILRAELVRDRQAFMDNFGLSSDPTKRREERLLNPEELENRIEKARQALTVRAEDLNRRDRDLARLQTRYLSLQRQYELLRDTDIVCSTLVWNTGYPLGGTTGLGHYFDDRRNSARTLWFQAAGDSQGQSWTGLFRDRDDNGVMEFSPASVPPRPGRWTSELNFLGWHPYRSPAATTIPKGVRLRITVQWREVHAPELFDDPADPYRQPLVDLRLRLFRQLDPTGRRLPLDDLELVAQSAGLPQRLDNLPDSATYEQSIEATLPDTGCYAVRLEGHTPQGTHPAQAIFLPANDKAWELWPHIDLQVLDEQSRHQGRVVFWDYSTDRGSIGLPAGSATVWTVGAARSDGLPEASSTSGTPLDRALLIKPDLRAFDSVQLGLKSDPRIFGSSVATPLASGIAACLLSAGYSPAAVSQMLRHYQPGEIFHAPPTTLIPNAEGRRTASQDAQKPALVPHIRP